MGRFTEGTDAETKALYGDVAEATWRTAMWLMAEEVQHNATCSDPACGGIIFPWVDKNVTNVKEARMFLSIVLERMADMISGGILMGELSPPPTEPQ